MKYIINTDDLYGGDIYKSMLLMGTNGKGEVIVQKFNLDELEELNSDYINEHYGSLQDEAYQRGLDAAWEAAKKLVLMDTETSENVTGYFGLFRIMENLTPVQAIEKIKAYEEKQSDKIKVGDEVIYNERKYTVFTTETEEHYASLFDVNGNHASASQSKCKKTGRHFDIDKILEAMKE